MPQDFKIQDLYIGMIVYMKHGVGEITLINGIDNCVQVKECDSKGNNLFNVYNIKNISLHPIPKFDYSNLDQVKDLHYELWEWLQENPDKEKRDWPRFESNGGDVPDPEFLCFLCSYTLHKNKQITNVPHLNCDLCPGRWYSENYGVPCKEGIFGIYEIINAHADKKSDINLTIKEKCARIIKNIC